MKKSLLLLLTMCFLALSNAFGAATVYLQEDFESGTIPTSWTQQVVSTNVANWAIESRSASVHPDSVGNASNYHVALRNTTGEDKHYVTKLITPEINFAGASYVYQPMLVFNHAQPGYVNDVDTLKLYYRPNANSAWTLLKVYQGRIDNWTKDTVELMGYAGATAYQLAFESVENMGWGIVLDDICVLNKSACQPVTEVAMSVPGTTSVTLAWAGDQAADSFEIVVSATAITDWTASYTPVFHAFATDFSIEITGLTPSTTYYAYVRSSCNDNETGWTDWAEGTFITRARIDIPYVENFSSAMPYGWVAKSDLTGKPAFSGASASASTMASYSVDSTFAMQFSGITAGKYAMVITPQVNVPSLQGVELGFWGYAGGTYYRTPFNSYIAKMYVGVVDDPEEVGSLVIVDSVEIGVAYKHQHFTVSFENYSGTGKYLVFLVSDPKRTAYFYIDHVTVDQPAALTPTDVQIVNAGPDGFDVKVKLHGTTKWNLRVASSAKYKHMNVLPSEFLVSQDGINGNTYHVTGNFGDQVVAVYAQAVSGTNTSAWSFPTTLRIPARGTLPLTYEFDEDGTVPVKGLDNEIHITNSNKTFQGLYFPLLDLTNFFPKLSSAAPKYGNTSHLLLQGSNQWIALPYIDSFAGQMVSFRLATATEDQSRVAVGIMKDAYDLSTFTKLDEFEGPTGSYVKCEVDLDGLDSLGHYVAIVAITPEVPNTSYGSVNYIDALHVEAIPSCRLPNEVVAGDEGVSINLHWNARGMSKWLVELFAGSNADSLLASQEVLVPSAVFSGLTTNTSYYYRLSTICGEEITYGEDKVLYTTDCERLALPWTEDFESCDVGNYSSSALPCWNQLNVNTGTSSTYPQAYVSNTSTYVKSGTKSMYFKSSSTKYAYVITPRFSAPLNTLKVSFSHKESNMTSAGYVEVGYMTDKNKEKSFVQLARFDRKTAWQDEEVYLDDVPAEVASNAYLAFRFGGGTANATYAGLDDISVEVVTGCKKVKDLKVSNVTSSSASVTWTPRGSEPTWEYLLTDPDKDLDWSNATQVSTSSLQLTGLNGSTTYRLSVRAICSATEQSSVESVIFRTNCGTITSFPWSEGFEGHATGTSSSAAPDCWSTLHANEGTYPYIYVNNTSTYVYSGSQSLYFSASKSRYSYAIFPEVGVALNTLRLSFMHKESNATSCGVVSVGYMTNPADSTSFVSLATYGRLSEWREENLSLSEIPANVPAATRLAFRFGGGSANGGIMGLDDVTLRVVDNSCPGLGDFSAGSNSPSTLVVHWSAGGTVQTIDIEVADTANFVGARQFTGVTANPFVLDSLRVNTTYYVRARQSCDVDGEWKTATVKTLCNPIAPENYPVQDFEGTNDLECWQVGVSVAGKQSTANPSIGTLAARGHYLYFNKSATTSDTLTRGDGLYAIMPMLDIDSIKGYEISFNAFKTSTATTNAGKLAVGVITDPSDFSTFTLVQNFDLEYAADSLSEKSYTVHFLNYTGDYNGDYGKYIVFYALSGDKANAIGVDNVEVRVVSSCPQIAEGIISDIVSDGATYSWTGTGAPAYEVRLLTEQMNPDSATTQIAFVDTVSVDSIVIRGVSAAKTYFAYVRALCSDMDASRWSSYTRFRTECGIETIPYVQNFDEAESLECFGGGNMQSTTSTYSPYFVTATYLYTGTRAVRLYAYKSSTLNADSSYLVLPEMNFGAKGLRGHTLGIHARSYGSSTSYYKHMQVGVIKGEDMSSFQRIRDIELTDSYELYEVSLENSNDTANRIAILAVIDPTSTATTKYGYVYMDDITVFQTPTCKVPASIEASTTRRTIDVKITPKADGLPDHYELVCADTLLDEVALEAAEKIQVDTTGLYTITGLTRNTLYYLYARAHCGAEDGASDWISLPIKTKNVGPDCRTSEPGTLVNSTSKIQYVPWSDYYKSTRSEQIYTKEELLAQGLHAGYVSKVAFQYALNTAYTKTITLFMGSTNESVLTGSPFMELEAVTDEIPTTFSADGTWYEFELTNPYYWDGESNLVVGMLAMGTDYPSSGTPTFYGTTEANNMARYSRSDSAIPSATSGTLTKNRANVRFSICPPGSPCPTVLDLTSELLGAGISEVMLRWIASDGDYLSGYDVIVSDTVVAYPDSVAPTYANVQGDSLHVTGLIPETLYNVYVRANCKAEGKDDGSSEWVNATFETLANCPAVTNLTSELYTAANTVKVTWIPALEDQELHFAYVCSIDSLDKAGLGSVQKTFVNDTLAFEISDLAYDQKYHIYVASVCGEKFSPWTETTITTDPACAPVRNLTAARIEHNRVILTWNPSRFGSETQWEVGIVGDSTNVLIVTDTSETVSTMLVGLNSETQYTAYVRAICADGSYSSTTTLPFTTAAASAGGCITVGEGTTDGYLVPFNNLYKNAWTQTIYTAEEIGQGGAISSLWINCTAVVSDVLTQSVAIYLGHTQMAISNTTTDWVPQGDLVQVYANPAFTHPSETGWIEFVFDEPFVYNGTDNLAVVFSVKGNTYKSGYHYAYTAGTSGVTLYRRNDSDATYGDHPGTAAGTMATNKTNTQFCFAQSGGCASVTALKVDKVTVNTAVASWEPMGSERSWEVYLADTVISNFNGLHLDTVYHYVYPMSNLLDDKDYWFYVRPTCDADWKEVKFTTVAVCSAPIELDYDSVTAEHALLSWTDAFSVGQSYIVAYGLADSMDLTDPSTYQTKTVQTPYVWIDSLEEVTMYAFAVQSVCDNGLVSRFSEIATFQTPCAVKPMGWLDSFENAVYCWYVGNRTNSGSSYIPGIISSANSTSNAQYVRTGVRAFKMYAYKYSTSTNADSAYVIVPEIDYGSAGLQGAAIRFYARSQGTSTSTTDYYKHVEIGVIKNRNIRTYEKVKDVNITNGYEMYEVSFANYTGEGDRIVFLATVNPNTTANTRYCYVYFDDFQVFEAPTCWRPENVSVVSAAGDSASFTWTAGAGEAQWQYTYTPFGMEPDWTNAVLTDTMAATIAGLSPASSYNFHVRSYCSATDQSNHSSVTFKSAECGVVTQLPWKEGFEAYEAGTYSATATTYIPACWNMAKTATSGNAYPHVAASGSYAYPHSGENVLVTYGKDTCYAVMPAFAAPLNELQITFYYRTYNAANCGYLVLGYVTADSTFHGIQQFDPIATMTKAKVLLNNLPDSLNARLAFMYTGGSSSAAYNVNIDDITVGYINYNCAGVSDVHVSDFGLTNATVEWGYTLGNHSAEVQIATDAAFEEIVDSALVTNDSIYTSTVLNSGTKYYVRVRQACDDDEFSEWADMIDFTTSYGLPFVPRFTSTTVPSDWMRSNTEAAQVFAGTAMATETAGWNIIAADTVINSYHFRGNIFGTAWHHWIVTPAIDMTPNLGEGVLLSFDAGLVAYSTAREADLYTGVDDRFLVAVSTDGGNTWNPADVTEWNNSGTGQYVYNEVPKVGTRYIINMSNYAGKNVKIGFYGQSTVANADNWFHFGNIRMETVATTTYVDTICEGYSFSKNGFTVPYEDLQLGLNVVSRYEMNADSTMALTVQQIWVMAASVTEIPVTLCEGEHFNGYGFDFTASVSENIRRRVDGGNQYGCDSTVILQVTVNPVVRTEKHIGVNEDSYTWKGKTYYQSTVIYDTASAVTGCDSITAIYLTFCEGKTYKYHNAFCAGGSYSDEFFENLTAPGVYTGSITDEIGCATYAELTLHQLASGQDYTDSVHVSNLPYVLGNDTLCPETDQPGFVYHGWKDFGCGRVNVTIYVYDKTALDNVKAGVLTVAPNPVRIGEDIRILTSVDLSSDYSCRVFDAVGKLVYETDEPSTVIPGLPTAGAYTVRIAAGNKVYQAKLIVK